MDCLHIEKAITFIAKGIREKENTDNGQRMPYCYTIKKQFCRCLCI